MRRRRLSAAAVAIAAAAWIAGVAPGGGDAADASTCGPAPAGRVAVMVVVDDGVRAPSVRCVEVAERSTGYDVLRAAGHQLRIEAGFLCAIDGQPATGCANRPDFDGSYWRYFHGVPGGGWSYSNVGGGGYRMPPRCAIEGWRFSGAAGTNVTPRTPPPPVRCDAAPTTTAPRPAAPPASAPASPRPPVSRPAPAAPTTADAPPPGAPGAATAPAGGAEGRGAAGGGSPSAGGRDSPVGTAPGVDEEPEEQRTSDGAAGEGPGTADSSAGEVGPEQGADRADETAGELEGEARAAAVDGPPAGGPGSPVGVVLVGVLILALGLASWVRSRRRRGGVGVAGPTGNA